MRSLPLLLLSSLSSFVLSTVLALALALPLVVQTLAETLSQLSSSLSLLSLASVLSSTSDFQLSPLASLLQLLMAERLLPVSVQHSTMAAVTLLLSSPLTVVVALLFASQLKPAMTTPLTMASSLSLQREQPQSTVRRARCLSAAARRSLFALCARR